MTHIPLSPGRLLSDIHPGDLSNVASSTLPAIGISLQSMVSIPKLPLAVAFGCACCASVCCGAAVSSAWGAGVIAGVSLAGGLGVSAARVGEAISTARSLSSVPSKHNQTNMTASRNRAASAAALNIVRLFIQHLRFHGI